MERRWVRLGGVAAVASVIVALATFPLVGSSPKSSASAAAVGTYISSHHGDLRTVGVMVVLAAALFMWFAGTLAWWVQRRDASSPIALLIAISAATSAAFLAMDGVTETLLSFLGVQAGSSSPATTAVFDLQDGIVMPGAYGLIFAIFLAAVAAAAFGTAIGTRWLGYLASILAVLSAAGGVSGLVSVDGGNSSPFSFAPAFATAVIGIAASIALDRQVGPGQVTTGRDLTPASKP